MPGAGRRLDRLLHLPNRQTLAEVHGSGAVAQGGAVAAGKRDRRGRKRRPRFGGRSIHHFQRSRSHLYIGEAPVRMTAVDRDTTLGRYLQHHRPQPLPATARHPRGRQVGERRTGPNLHSVAHHSTAAGPRRGTLVARGTEPGSRRTQSASSSPEVVTETVTVTVEAALAQNPRLVVLGDPGSGKTTLLRYLALSYARDWAEKWPAGPG